MDISSFIKSSDGYMDFINYLDTYREDNKEFLRGDMWQLNITPPKIVYFPGKKIINARLNSVNVSIDSGVNGFEKRMRGNYVIYQKTGQNTSGTLSLGFVDREDQAITYFVDDWKQKISDRNTKFSFRKDDLVCPLIELIFTNATRLSVRRLLFYNCIIADAPLDENGVAEDGTDRSDIQLVMQFEHYERKFDNLA